jgi:hypothetical protein
VNEGEVAHVRLATPSEVVRLHGFVRAGGEPLASASLRASRVDERDYYYSGRSSSKAGADGAYELSLPGPGRYWVSIAWREEASLSWRVTVDVPAVETLEFDVSIPVGRISGRVTDAQGQALAGVQVESEPERHDGGAHGSARAVTDAEGRYEIVVPAGQHALTADNDPGRFWDREVPYAKARKGDLVVAENGHLRGVDFRLDTGGILEGVVRRTDGSGAARARVAAWDDTWQEDALCDDGGRFRMRLATGSYLVSAVAGSDTACLPLRVDIASGATRSIDLELLPARRVRLSIRENGAPVGCNLNVLDGRGERQRVQTGDNGTAWLGPLVPGRYTVRAQRDGKTVERAFEVTGAEEALELELVFE